MKSFIHRYSKQILFCLIIAFNDCVFFLIGHLFCEIAVLNKFSDYPHPELFIKVAIIA